MCSLLSWVSGAVAAKKVHGARKGQIGGYNSQILFQATQEISFWKIRIVLKGPTSPIYSCPLDSLVFIISLTDQWRF